MNKFLEPISLDEFQISFNEYTNQVSMNEASLRRLMSEGQINFSMQEDQSFLLFYKGHVVYLIK